PEGYINMLKAAPYAGVMNAHLHLVPGRGEVDFPALFRALEGIGYQGAVSAIPFGSTDAVELAQESYDRIRGYAGATVLAGGRSGRTIRGRSPGDAGAGAPSVTEAAR